MKNLLRKVLLVCICVLSVVGVVAFAACATDKPQGDTITYTVTVTNENDEAMAGVKVRLAKGSAKWAYVTTGNDGKATFSNAEDTYDVLFDEATIPEGYTAPEGVKVTKDEPEVTAKLVKKSGYTVKLVDEDGNPFYRAGIMIAICDVNGQCKTPSLLKEDGTWAYYTDELAEYKVQITLPDGVVDEYTFDGYSQDSAYYDGEHFTKTVTEMYITIKKVVDAATEVSFTRAGTQTVTVNSAAEYATVYFAPEVTGKYEITSIGDYDTRVEYYANSMLMNTITGSDDDSGDGKNFKYSEGLDFPEVGPSMVFRIYVKAEAEAFPAKVSVKITRLESSSIIIRKPHSVTPEQLGDTSYGNGRGEYHDVVLSTAQTVVKGDDGYYHLGDENGAILVVKLAKSFRDDFGIFVTSNGNGREALDYLVAFADAEDETIFWDYTSFFDAYAKKCNDDGVYAVNDELKTMLERWAASCINENTPFINELGTIAAGNEWLIPCGYYNG